MNLHNTSDPVLHLIKSLEKLDMRVPLKESKSLISRKIVKLNCPPYGYIYHSTSQCERLSV